MSSALTAIYIATGFDNSHKLDSDKYETAAERHGGHIGIMDNICTVAEAITTWIGSQSRNEPGVWEYEVAEAIGVWIFFHPEATNEEIFNHAIKVTEEWMHPNEKSTSP